MAEEAPGLHTKAGLLTGIEKLFEWVRVEGAHDHNLALAESKYEIRVHWDALFPYERVHLFDLVMEAFCTSRIHPGFPWETLSFAHLRELIGYQTPELTDIGRLDADRSAQLVSRLIADVGGRGQDRPAVTAWRTAFLSEAGLTKPKFTRMRSAMRRLVTSEISGLLNYSQAGVLPFRNLPSADTILRRAYAACEDSAYRFDTFVGLVNDLVTLYRTPTKSTWRDLAALQTARAHDLKHLKALVAWLGWKPEPLEESVADSHFRQHVSTEGQIAAIDRVRALVYAKCQEYIDTGKLSCPEKEIVETLRGMDNTAQLAEAWKQYRAHPFELPPLDSSPPRRNPLMLDGQHYSLAHCGGPHPARISDRYAQRYYRTTAAQWEAERAAEGAL